MNSRQLKSIYRSASPSQRPRIRREMIKANRTSIYSAWINRNKIDLEVTAAQVSGFPVVCRNFRGKIVMSEFSRGGPLEIGACGRPDSKEIIVPTTGAK